MSINIAISVADWNITTAARERTSYLTVKTESTVFFQPRKKCNMSFHFCCVLRRIPFFRSRTDMHRDAELNACACFQFPGPFLYLTFQDFKQQGTNLSVDRLGNTLQLKGSTVSYRSRLYKKVVKVNYS